MRNLSFIFIALLVLEPGCTFRNSVDKEARRPLRINGVELERVFRDYVLYKSIVGAFGNDTLFNRDITPAVYNDLTDYAFAGPAGKRLDSLVQLNLASLEPSEIADYEGKTAIFMHCVDYYNSEELREDVQKIINEVKISGTSYWFQDW